MKTAHTKIPLQIESTQQKKPTMGVGVEITDLFL